MSLAALIERHMLMPIAPGTEDTCCALAVFGVLAEMGLPRPVEDVREAHQAARSVLDATARVIAGLSWPEAETPRAGDVGVVHFVDGTGKARQFIAICDGRRWCVKTAAGAYMLPLRRSLRAWRPQ